MVRDSDVYRTCFSFILIGYREREREERCVKNWRGDDAVTRYKMDGGYNFIVCPLSEN